MGDELSDLFANWQPGAGGSEPGPEERPPQDDGGDLTPVQISGVYRHGETEDTSASQFSVELEDVEGRRVPIFIGRSEAEAIALAQAGQRPDRPMTHDLLCMVVERLGARVTGTVVDDIWHSTFYARLRLEREGEEVSVDCRPSDAIAVAVRTGAEIVVAERVFRATAPRT